MFLKLLKRNINDISFRELNEFIKLDTRAILLDVRSPQEYNEEHLKNAINIPLYELDKCCLKKLNKENLIIVYCQSGIRSKKAIKILYKNGFNILYNLKNGLDGI